MFYKKNNPFNSNKETPKEDPIFFFEKPQMRTLLDEGKVVGSVAGQGDRRST